MVLFNAWDSRMNTWKNIQQGGRDGADRFVAARTLIPGRAVMFATRNVLTGVTALLLKIEACHTKPT